jgi:hypothetical protein
MFKIAAMFFAFAALPAGAQITTNCNTYGSQTNCATDSRPGVDWGAYQRQQQMQQQQMNNSISNLGAAMAARRERQREQAYMLAQQQAENDAAVAKAGHDNLIRGITTAASEGKCVEAEQDAMANALVELANQITTYCATHFPSGK